MLVYTIRRLVSAVPIIILMGFLIFGMLHVTPGDPAALIAGDQASPEDIARIRALMGLDRPFLVQLGAWAWAVLHGDLGTSLFTGLPITTMVAQRIEPTLSIMILTVVISVAVAVPLGVLAASRRGTAIDNVIAVISVIGFSVPVFVVGYCLSYVFALKLNLFPVQGYSPLRMGLLGYLQSIILPSVSLSSVYIALVTRMTRAAVIEVLSQDYIRTASSKGLGPTYVLFTHALKNAAVPITTVVGIGIALLIGGSVVVETVFSIPGVGRLVMDAIVRRDFPVIQGVLLIFSFVYVIINLLIDLSYPLLDPRIRY